MSVEKLRGTTRIGYLISGSKLQMCILCCSRDGYSLPIVIISPLFPWTTDDMIDVKIESLALFVASIFLFSMESLSFEDGEMYLLELAQANVV